MDAIADRVSKSAPRLIWFETRIAVFDALRGASNANHVEIGGPSGRISVRMSGQPRIASVVSCGIAFATAWKPARDLPLAERRMTIHSMGVGC